MAAPTANKLNDIEKQQVKAMIAKLDGRGWTQHMMRDEIQRRLGLNISQPMVGIYRKQVYADISRDYAESKANSRDIKLEQLKDVRREAWTAYDRSMLDSEKVVEEFADATEQVGFDDFVTSEHRIKRIVTREGRLPENAYLTTVLKTLEQERQLLGLDPEKPQAQTNVNVVVAGAEFWQGLAKQVAAQMPMAVEQRVIMAVEAQPEPAVVPVTEPDDGSV